MLSIYEFSSYRDYLNQWIESQPNKGRGLKGRLSRHLGVSSTLVSFILSGRKPLTLEQASELADFIGLGEGETDFLFLLVEKERAGNFKLREKLEKRIRQNQEQARKIAKRVKKDVELSDELQAIYYSSWVYTGIRNLVATGSFRDAAMIAERLNLPYSTVSKVLRFLLENRLCLDEGGRIVVGPAHTHTGVDSPHVNKHLQNWRLRGFTMMEQKSDSDLFYTAPMSLSVTDAERLRAMILQYIQEVLAVVRPSNSETVRCLNIDWFEY